VIPIILIVAFGAYVLFSNPLTGSPDDDEEFLTSSEEWTFLSIGLYENSTHPCERHHVSCEAEFRSTDLSYRVFNQDGSYVVEGTGFTAESGFFDIYLPKGEVYEAHFEISGRKGSGTISTEAGASNCITDIRVTSFPVN
jgi:hypothetical protein